ncbi:MAG: hypothetical protein IPL08_17645 [Saprospiraceae bacterium]|nr:hypothetical protein [Saprospiraceae bacterium]
MKKSSFLLLCLCVFYSCSKENIKEANDFPQKWQLFEMTGQIPNSVTTGINMDRQEYYILKSNNTFVKHREKDGKTFEVKGVFVIKDGSDGKYIELTYDSKNDLIGNCDSSIKEYLSFKSDSEIYNTWSACDGPGLKYKKAN